MDEGVVSLVAVAGPQPMFTKDTMPEVSPTLWCVMGLGVQFFLIYTCLAVIRTVNQFSSDAFAGAQKVFEAASTTVNSAPMLCVLFLAARMRAIQLTQGETEKYHLPQPWVQKAMYIASYCVMAQLGLVLIVPILTCGAGVDTDEDGNLDTNSLASCDLPDTLYFGCLGGAGAMLLVLVRFAIMVVLGAAFTTVIVGIFLMDGPMLHLGVSPAVMTTIMLAATFFVVQALVILTRTAVELRAACGYATPSPLLSKLGCALILARNEVHFSPMLAILFIGVRMRSLQMDPVHGNPQGWAQSCFYCCAWSLLIQALTVIVMPFCVTCEVKKGEGEGNVAFVTEEPMTPLALNVIRYIGLFVLYVGIVAVCISVFTITHPYDVKLTPPISPAMLCVMNLTLLFFGVYFLRFISTSLAQLSGLEVSRMVAILEGARVTVMFAPMLSVLFLGVRMRALQLTRATDGTIPTSAGPQPWVQDGMFLATWSVLVQLIMVILVPICTGAAKPEFDQMGNVKAPEGVHKCLGLFIEVIHYTCLIAMYGGISLCVTGVFMMTPENLPPYSEQGTVLPGTEVPHPPLPPTKAEVAHL
jgi:hypothetical protein